MAHGTTKHHAQITEKVVLDRFQLVVLLCANAGKKDLLQGRLFFHILHRSRWKQLFELPKRAVGENLALMEQGLPHRVWLRRHITSIDDGSSAVLFEQRGEDFEQRCLACAVGAEQ